MKQRASGARGFTLVELLVVIAVIGALSLLLLPALAKTNGDVDKTYCQNSMRQIGLASQLYVKDNGDRFADAYSFGYAWTYFYGGLHYGPPSPEPAKYEKYFQDYFYPYVGTNINEPVTRPTAITAANYNPQRGIFTCPASLRIKGIIPQSEDYYFSVGQFYANRGVSYVWNYAYWKYTGNNVGGGSYSAASCVSNRKVTSVRDASIAVLIFECPYHEARYMPHGMGMNVLHADGSVGYFKENPKGEIWPGSPDGGGDWSRFHSQDGWD